MADYKIILYYKYTPIENPEKLREEQMRLCKELGLTGRIIIATEGINGTLEGTAENIEKYWQDLTSKQEFKDIQKKISDGTGSAFPKLSVKVRSEIVAGRLGEDDVKPWNMTGKYLQPEELHQWIKDGKKFYIVDMRNDFEHKVGYFKDSILPPMQSFADLPKVLPLLKDIKDEVIVTVCTGGVRCEKASGFLVKHGFKNVYQLYGGIVSYMEAYPGEDFTGSLYVFDNRLVMGFNGDPNRKIVGECVVCKTSSENYINCRDDFCHRHFIICTDCVDDDGKKLCPMGCRDYSLEHPEAFPGHL